MNMYRIIESRLSHLNILFFPFNCPFIRLRLIGTRSSGCRLPFVRAPHTILLLPTIIHHYLCGNNLYTQQGFVFPPETGYPLDPSQARFYLMETHYNNPRNVEDLSNWNQRQKADSSGLKLYYTEKVRKFDAGVLSVGKCSCSTYTISWSRVSVIC